MLISTKVDVLSNGRSQNLLSEFNGGGAIYLSKPVYVYISFSRSNDIVVNVK